MSDLVAADTFLWSRLTAAPAVAAGQVYVDEAPQGTTGQYVVIAYMGGADDLTEVGAVKVWANVLYLVKVVGPGRSYTALEPNVTAIEARLSRASGPVGATVYVDSCIREQPFRMPETTPSGSPFRHAGAMWRLKVRAL